MTQHPPTTLVCFALEAEAAPFRSWARAQPHIRIRLTGIGPGSTERSLRQELTRPLPAAVWSCGFAGGLNPALVPGTVVFSADDNWPWTTALAKTGAQRAMFHCTSRIVPTAKEKLALWTETGAAAVEMESAVIRKLCRAAGVPSATVRVISDAAGEDLPLDFNRFMSPNGKLSYLRLAAAVLVAPHRLRPLIRLQQTSRRAAEVLAATLQRVMTT